MIQKTIAVHPSVRDIVPYIKKKLLVLEAKNIGFVLDVKKIVFKNQKISFIGNYIFDVEAEVEVFMPKEGMVVDAVVDMNRGTAHLALVEGRLTVLFHSQEPIVKDSKVRLELKSIRFQCATFRAVGELCI